MKHLRNIILLALFVSCASLAAQDPPENPSIEPEVPEQTSIEETVETVIEAATEEATEDLGQTETDVVPEDSTPTEGVVVQAEPILEDAAGTIAEAIPAEDKEWINRGEVVIVGGDNVLGPNEKAKAMVTVAGSSQVDGYVDGDMVTVLGNSTVNGSVDGDYVVVMGSATIGPDAWLDGDTVVIGGKLDIHPDARVDGEKVNIPFFPPGMIDHFHQVPTFIRECVFLGRPISPNVPFTFYVAGVFLVFYILLAALFPKPMERCRIALEEKPFQSFLAGILVHAAHPAFVILMAIIVIGLVLVPFVDLALLAFSIFGKAVVFVYIGRQVARAIRVSALENTILSILIGGIIVYALYMIPFFGLFLWLVLSTLGLGAVCIAIGNVISERKADRLATMPPASTVAEGGEGAVPPPVPQVVGPVQPGTSLNQVDPATAAIFARVGFWWRLLATLIDLILVAVIVNLLNIGVPIIPLFAYFILFWGWKGSTLGGMALGIRIQKLSGEPLDWSTAIIRSLSTIVSFLPFFIGFFWAGWDPENQSWHDKIAGTVVVRIPKGYTWS